VYLCAGIGMMCCPEGRECATGVLDGFCVTVAVAVQQCSRRAAATFVSQPAVQVATALSSVAVVLMS
jgi:hypothetical protein